MHTYTDENGRTHVLAIPSTPTAPKQATRSAEGLPASQSSRSHAQRARTRAETEADPCLENAQLVHEWADVDREIKRKEQEIEAHSETDVAFSSTICSDSSEARGTCVSSSFNRDGLIAAAEARIKQLEEKLDDIESKAREKGMPQHCFTAREPE